MTAAAAVVGDGRGGYAVREIEVGPPGPGEVRVAVAASGVCHTDLQFAEQQPVPLVLGHEGAGTVEAVGPGVEAVTPGDRVLLTWAIACGQCFQCVRGSQVLCERLGTGPGGHAHPEATTLDGAPLARAFNLGTMSSLTVVRQEAVVALPDHVPFPSACIMGCGVMTGYGSVVNAARVEPGSSVVVLGCGGVGLNVIQGARIAGAAVIVAVDPNPNRRKLARQLGATSEVEAGATVEESAARVREVVGPRGADYAFECTAVPELGAAPLAMVRHGGVAIQVSGVEQEIAVDMRLFEWDKTYLNPLYGQCRPSVDFPRLFALYARGDLLLDEQVTRTYPLAQVADAFADMLAGRNAKGVLLP